MKARCRAPVQIYEQGVEGVYEPGQIIGDDRAARLVEQYPRWFEAVREERPARKKEGKD